MAPCIITGIIITPYIIAQSITRPITGSDIKPVAGSNINKKSPCKQGLFYYLIV
jgi:hypothetical protein